MQEIYDKDGYLKWSASQHRQVKSICGWKWALERLTNEEPNKSTMSRAVGSTGHKVNELSLIAKHKQGSFPDVHTINQWSDDWFYYYIEKDGHRLLSHEKDYYKSDKDCIEDYAALSRQLCRICVDKCTKQIDPEIIKGELQIEIPWHFKIEDFKIKMRGRWDIVEKGNVVSDIKFKGSRPLIKEKDCGAQKVSSIEKDEQFIIYSTAASTIDGEYPTVRAHYILHKKKMDIYDPVEFIHNDHHMQVLYNNLKGIKPLIDEVVSSGNYDMMLPASEYGFLCNEDFCDYWNVCDKHY